jgi:hypothetical protein
VERGAWSVECGVWSVECGVWSVECGVWSVECGAWFCGHVFPKLLKEYPLLMCNAVPHITYHYVTRKSESILYDENTCISLRRSWRLSLQDGALRLCTALLIIRCSAIFSSLISLYILYLSWLALWRVSGSSVPKSQTPRVSFTIHTLCRMSE